MVLHTLKTLAIQIVQNRTSQKFRRNVHLISLIFWLIVLIVVAVNGWVDWQAFRDPRLGETKADRTLLAILIAATIVIALGRMIYHLYRFVKLRHNE